MKRWIIGLVMVVAGLGLSACGEDDGDTIAGTPGTHCLEYGNCHFNYGQYQGWSPYNVENGYYVGQYNNYQNGFCGCQNGYLPAYGSQYGLGCVQSGLINPNNYDYSGLNFDSNAWAWFNLSSEPYQPFTAGNTQFAYPGSAENFYNGTQPNNLPGYGNAYNPNIGFNNTVPGYNTIPGVNNAPIYGGAPGFNNVATYPNQPGFNYGPTAGYAPANNGCAQQVLRACDQRTANSCGSNGYCRLTGGGGYLGTCVYN